MSRRQSPAAVVHLRIGRLVIDADALDGRAMPRDLDAQLQAALLPLLGGGPLSATQAATAKTTAVTAPWVDAIAGQVAAQVRPSLPGPTP